MSFSRDVEPCCLLLLLAELSLESILSPNLSSNGLTGKKKSLGGEPKVNFSVSSKYNSGLLISLRKTFFNLSTPLCRSTWIHWSKIQSTVGNIPSCGIFHQRYQRQNTALLNLVYDPIDVTHPPVHAQSIRNLHHFVWHPATRQYCGMQVDPRILQQAAYLFRQHHHFPRFAFRDIIRAHHCGDGVCIFLTSSISREANI